MANSRMASHLHRETVVEDLKVTKFVAYKKWKHPSSQEARTAQKG